MEDQTDEDFFDNLVDDEDNLANNNADLSIEETGTGTILDSLDSNVGGSVEGESSVEVGGVTGVSEVVDRESSDEFEGTSGVNAISVGFKEVEWSALSGVTQDVSHSDFFDRLGVESADPFAQVTSLGSFSVGQDGEDMRHASPLDGVLPNQTTTSSLCNVGLHREDVQHASPFVASASVDADLSNQVASSRSYSIHALPTESANEVQDQNSVRYWESLYPGWRYDQNTGQWYPLDGSDAIVNPVENINANALSTTDGATVSPSSDNHYLCHTVQSVMTEESTSRALSNWNQAAYGNTEYPAHMVFDPQYPGWYYDTIAQEWRSLESYSASINPSTSLDQNQLLSYGSVSTVNYYPVQNVSFGQGEQVQKSSYQLDQPLHLRDYGKDSLNALQPGKSEVFRSAENTKYGNGFMPNGPTSYRTNHRPRAPSYQNSFFNEPSKQVYDSSTGIDSYQGIGVAETGFQNISLAGNAPHYNNHYKEFDQQLSNNGFNGSNVHNFSLQPLQNGRFSYSSYEGRSADGRPPHALVTFGFGGKLIVMKDHSLYTLPAYASQDSAGGAVSILNVMELAMPKNNGSDVGISGGDYFSTLSQQSYMGPLVSGNVGSKELNKWIDDRIADCNAPDADCSECESLKMLLSVLKIACQYYGKLRSAFGTDHISKETDSPESALAKLFSSAKKNGAQFSAISQCLQNMPSEGQMLATAEEVQMLLVSGRKMEALQCAQNGHLWGLAIVISTLLGEQFYGETVKQMALHQLVPGSPLRTLCLLIAGQPAEVFSTSISSNPQNGVNAHSSGVGFGCMLDGWEENLAMISANRTKGDELVITHLGDCLWKEKDEITAAHISYLVAEADIESYSESARLCLVGANHLKYPRTYASPQAIQRTELYEYAKVLGNSQCVLLPFQPYKLIYACMLAEVGKISDSLKYCQAVLKSLKTGRSPEVDAWRQMVSSLEERIKIHQQGGYATNFSRTKLVGKLLNFFDNTAHRVVGGLPPQTPSTSHSDGQPSERDHQSRGPRVSTSQSTMAMSSLLTSASADSSNHMSMHNRSMSEPNFGRTPRKDESPKSSLSSSSDHTSLQGSSSRFGRFGSQIFQKTVGLVLKSHSNRQAKLGDTNKFYYDEKLKRWVEEGAEPQAQEMILSPPPTTTYMNGMPNHDKKLESNSAMIHANGEIEYKYMNSNGKSAELPPIPSGLNHFSARGRMGVRSRYVDTFNKGGGTPINSFQAPSPLVPATKPHAGNPKIFIPTSVPEGQEIGSMQSTQHTEVIEDNTTTSSSHDSFSSPLMFSPPSTIHRHPSMDKGMGSMINNNVSLPPNSRRTLSWGGGLDIPNHTSMGESSPGALGFQQST